MKLATVVGFICSLLLFPFVWKLTWPASTAPTREMSVAGAAVQLFGRWTHGTSQTGRWKLADAYANRHNPDGSWQGAIAIRVFGATSEYDQWISDVRRQMEPVYEPPEGVELGGEKCEIMQPSEHKAGKSVRYLITAVHRKKKYCIHFVGESGVVEESLDLLKRGWSWSD